MEEEKEGEQMPLIDQFKQQMLKSWQPVTTLTRTTVTFFILAVVFLGLGIPMLVLNSQIQEYSVRYDDCHIQITDNDINKFPCNKTITIPQEMQGPIFVYYEIDGFYQNHRLYANSISYSQLKGNEISESQASSDCDPIVHNKDIHGRTIAIDNTTTLDPEGIAYPCGMVAYTIFNDSFTLWNKSENLPILGTGITWPSDLKNFAKGNSSVMWYNVTEERFINWVRIASMPNFRKLWGRIEGSLNKGMYTIEINNSN
jgi:hypothetical protein